MFNTDSTQTANPPADFTAAMDIDGTMLGFWDGVPVERPGYEIQPTWSAENGLSVFIDHYRNDPYTVEEVRDLIATLTGMLQSHS